MGPRCACWDTREATATKNATSQIKIIMNETVHTFENGVRVLREHLLDEQIRRYAERNLHEPDEEPLFIELLETIPHHGVYVSVGTAIGYYAILAKKLRPDLQIYCFEPLPRHREYIRENLILNDLTESDVSIHALAVSGRSGGAVLIDSSFGSRLVDLPVQGHSLSYVYKKFKNILRSLIGTSVATHAIKLCELGSKVQRSEIHLVQMDIQGAEESVLAAFFDGGANKEFCIIRTFLVGTHGLRVHKSCRNLFAAGGYKVFVDKPKTPRQPDGILAATLGPLS